MEPQAPANFSSDVSAGMGFSSGIEYSIGLRYFLPLLVFSLFCIFTLVPEFDLADGVWKWGWPASLIVLLYLLVRLNHEMPDKSELATNQKAQLRQGEFNQKAIAAQLIVVILHFVIWIFNVTMSNGGGGNMAFQISYLSLVAVTSYCTWIWSSGDLPNIASIARLGDYLGRLEKDRRLDVRIFSVELDAWEFKKSELIYNFDPQWSICVIRFHGATEWNCLTVPTARKLDLPIRPRIRNLDMFCISGKSLLLHNEINLFLRSSITGDSEVDFEFRVLSPIHLFSETNVHQIPVKGAERDGSGAETYEIACQWDFSTLRHAAGGIKAALHDSTVFGDNQAILKMNLINIYCMLCTQEISPSVNLLEEENDAWLSGLNAYCEFVSQSLDSIEFIEQIVRVPVGRRIVPPPSTLFTFSPLHSFHSEYVSLSKLDLSGFQNDELGAYVMRILSASIDVLARFSKQFDNKGDRQLASQQIKSNVLLTLAMGLFSVRFCLEAGRR